MKKVINLGKIAYSGNRKINAVSVTIELKNKVLVSDYETLETLKNVPVLSICGEIWDHLHEDVMSSGQNIDEIASFFKNNAKVKQILNIWNEYHLNDLMAGTKKQTDAILAWKSAGNKYDYEKVCEYLKSIDLYIDRAYKYGSGWLYKSIPKNIISEINNI